MHSLWLYKGSMKNNSTALRQDVTLNWHEIPPPWMDVIGHEFDRPYMTQLEKFLRDERAAGRHVFPAAPDIFNALNTTSFEDVKIVLLGQDPYHGEGQAHGLAFSVQDHVPLPPSLRNIYKEIAAEYGVQMPRTGNLTPWAKQGVLLLNATLTVVQDQAGSHQKRGWEDFTDAIIRAVNDKHLNVVFMLWGSHAQKKGAFIDRKKHLVLEAPHPSPLSAHRGFLGCGHFKKANDYLSSHGKTPIEWQI